MGPRPARSVRRPLTLVEGVFAFTFASLDLQVIVLRGKNLASRDATAITAAGFRSVSIGLDRDVAADTIYELSLAEWVERNGGGGILQEFGLQGRVPPS